MGNTERRMIKPYNILYLANSGDIIGGGQISLIGLLDKLDRIKYNPIAVCPSEGELFDTLNKMGVKTQIVRMETLRNLNIFSWMKTVITLIRIIKRRKVDLIHSNGSRPTIYGGIAARLTKTSLIWHVRIADRDKLLDRFLTILSTKIIAISKAVQRRFEWLKEYKKKVTIIYNGIDVEKFNTETNGMKIKREFRIPSNVSVVGIVGRLDWYKGHQYFFEATKIVTKTIQNIHFLIVGDGEYRSRLENQVKQLSLEKKVTFTGNRDDIPEVLAGINLFVLSSVSEGFGRAAAEAMACGKPVVATKTGGLSEVVEDGITGILVSPRDPDELANAIVSLLNDKEKRDKIGAAGRKRVEELFTIETNVKHTMDMYMKVLGI